jgi:hypothetical protein
MAVAKPGKYIVGGFVEIIGAYWFIRREKSGCIVAASSYLWK